MPIRHVYAVDAFHATPPTATPFSIRFLMFIVIRAMAPRFTLAMFTLRLLYAPCRAAYITLLSAAARCYADAIIDVMRERIGRDEAMR